MYVYIYIYMYVYIYICMYIYIIYGKEIRIKLSFQVLRVSCKHSFTFFSLIITDVTYFIQCIGFLLSNVRIRGV